jgi:hypothetical protein
MPNHITNIVTISGATIQDILAITDTTNGDEGSKFDFNTIIPMPESVRNTVSGSHLSQDEKDRQAENVKQYGYATWYDFANAEWGTKWNAYDVDVDLINDCIGFDTAWAMPDPIFTKLSTMLPHATITVKFADEDIGHNCGIVVYHDGNSEYTDMAGDSHEARSFACEVKYGNADEWKQWEEED